METINVAIIFSENADRDLWSELLKFSYEANIVRFLKKKEIIPDKKTVDSIIGSFLQAYEYYHAAENANLQIKPLLLYYGSTNLLNGMTCLLYGKTVDIHDHGMTIDVSTDIKYISDTIIHFNDSSNGGVNVFAKALGYTTDLTSYGTWKLSEMLDSIAEIDRDYVSCYETQTGSIVMLDVFQTPDGIAEKIYYTDENRDSITNLLKYVNDFKQSYLQPTTAMDPQTKRKYIILRHKINGNNIEEISYSGQPYLRASHLKNGKNVCVPTILNMYISLFVLSSLCRYHPEIWSPFVLNDNSGERLLVDKLLFYCGRMIPNLVLNILAGDTIQYSSNRYENKNTIKPVGQHELQEIIDDKIKSYLERYHNNSNSLK